MKKYLALLLFALITSVSFGQSNFQDVVYLKNGSIIRGIIIKQVPNNFIKIETIGRNVFVYQMDEIEKLTREPYQGRGNRTITGNGHQTGYRAIVELGYEIGTGNFGMDRLKFNVINGYQFNPYFSLGFGTGLRYYPDAELALMPIFADFRANFMDNKVSPYLSLGVGYSFDATNSFEGVGLLLNPILGVSFMISEKSAMNVGIGYEMQRMQFRTSSGWNNRIQTFTENTSAISFNVGLSF